jgi:DMSO/TMAO reductase YedYZ molybdopterin-dependent catalytic subunit
MTLRTITRRPYNAEAELSALGARVTPVDAFYVRNNFDVPVLDAAAWRLRVHGRLHSAVDIDLATLQSMPQVRRRLTLECAGNGRSLMDPPVAGTAWGLGAAGSAQFTGVPLRHVLAQAAPHDDAMECVFTGADGGVVTDSAAADADGDGDGSRVVRFQRSLPLHVCLDEDGPMLVWAMNDEPLTPEHGFPLRLVVPNWYAVASVKWLVDIEVVSRAFTGHFQKERYVYRYAGPDGSDRAGDLPVTTMRVRALITSHADGSAVEAGEHLIEGVAWSGAGMIAAVEVAVGADGPWRPAALDAQQERGASVGWRCPLVLTAGPTRIRVRATDSSGAAQTMQPAWNELGYGFNPIHEIGLTALPARISRTTGR